jgi:uncharacterized protein RhaS with RHS repeats
MVSTATGGRCDSLKVQVRLRSGTRHYIESDPIGLHGGINTYAYARDNPLNLKDPYGLESGATLTAELRADGFKPVPDPVGRLRPETKAYICSLLKKNNGQFQSAEDMVYVQRLDNMLDPTLQETDDFLFAAGWTWPAYSLPWNNGAYTNWPGSAINYQLLKIPFPSISETPFSWSAMEAALAGIQHQHQLAEDALKWCNSCDLQ